MSIVAKAYENDENSINSNIVDSSPSNCLELQNDYDLDKDGVYNNEEPAVVFSCMAYIDHG